MELNVTESTFPTAQSASASPQRLPVVGLLTAQAISDIGNRITALAIPWFVFVTTGSAVKTGVIAFAGLVPVIISAILGGALVDRVGNKRMSVIADVMSGITVAVVPLLYLTIGLEFWELFVLAFLGGFSIRRAVPREWRWVPISLSLLAGRLNASTARPKQSPVRHCSWDRRSPVD